MPNIITPFGFVKKAGDTMTGDLHLGLNKLFLTADGKGGSIKGNPTVANRVQSLRPDGMTKGDFECDRISLTGDIDMLSNKTVDGVDVSEINKPVGGLYLGTSQEDIANETITKIDLDTKITGFGDNIEDTVNHEMTPGVAGLYLVIGKVKFTNCVADKSYSAFVYKEGTTQIAMDQVQSASTDNAHPKAVNIVQLTDTDTLDLRAHHNAGVGTVDVGAGAIETYLCCIRLR